MFCEITAIITAVDYSDLCLIATNCEQARYVDYVDIIINILRVVARILFPYRGEVSNSKSDTRRAESKLG